MATEIVLSYKIKLFPTRVKADTLAVLVGLFQRMHSVATQQIASGDRPRPPSTKGMGEFIGRAYRRAYIDYCRTTKSGHTPGTLKAELIDSAEIQKPRKARSFDCWIMIRGTGAVGNKSSFAIPARRHQAINRVLALPGAKLNESAEVFRKRGKWYAHVSVNVPLAEVQEPKGWVGVDVGVRTSVTRSDGYKGSDLRPILKRQKQRKADQQRNGIDRQTVTPQRHILAREARKAVTVCLYSGRGLAVEDPSRLIRWKGHASRFFAKRAILLAAILGVAVQPVPPPYTSTDCSKCGAGQGFRRREMFRCLSCGNTKNADVNASINVSRRAHGYRHSHASSPSLLPLGGGANG